MAILFEKWWYATFVINNNISLVTLSVPPIDDQSTTNTEMSRKDALQHARQECLTQRAFLSLVTKATHHLIKGPQVFNTSVQDLLKHSLIYPIILHIGQR